MVAKAAAKCVLSFYLLADILGNSLQYRCICEWLNPNSTSQYLFNNLRCLTGCASWGDGGGTTSIPQMLADKLTVLIVFICFIPQLGDTSKLHSNPIGLGDWWDIRVLSGGGIFFIICTHTWHTKCNIYMCLWTSQYYGILVKTHFLHIYSRAWTLFNIDKGTTVNYLGKSLQCGWTHKRQTQTPHYKIYSII